MGPRRGTTTRTRGKVTFILLHNFWSFSTKCADGCKASWHVWSPLFFGLTPWKNGVTNRIHMHHGHRRRGSLSYTTYCPGQSLESCSLENLKRTHLSSMCDPLARASAEQSWGHCWKTNMPNPWFQNLANRSTSRSLFTRMPNRNMFFRQKVRSHNRLWLPRRAKCRTPWMSKLPDQWNKSVMFPCHSRIATDCTQPSKHIVVRMRFCWRNRLRPCGQWTYSLRGIHKIFKKTNPHV